ncbi:MAG: hypothetical protein J7J82_01925 [Staphylothermus sp.]|nr:hypothetical protein [Staphylothermus sp.]
MKKHLLLLGIVTLLLLVGTTSIDDNQFIDQNTFNSFVDITWDFIVAVLPFFLFLIFMSLLFTTLRIMTRGIKPID